mmetsp:Transcript_40617/g.77564  ORF Transcript_40617/g.77564 Transcript_40617/m.77564 type:complete len:237 (+) Transcript_40617:1724-2434(+)
MENDHQRQSEGVDCAAGRVVDGVRFGPALDEHGEHGEAHVDGAQVAQHEGLEDAVVVRRHVAAHPGGGVREFHQGHVGARNHHHLPHAALVAQQVCHLAKQLHLAPLELGLIALLLPPCVRVSVAWRDGLEGKVGARQSFEGDVDVRAWGVHSRDEGAVHLHLDTSHVLLHQVLDSRNKVPQHLVVVRLGRSRLVQVPEKLVDGGGENRVSPSIAHRSLRRHLTHLLSSLDDGHAR